jgi:hypothetical protein
MNKSINLLQARIKQATRWQIVKKSYWVANINPLLRLGFTKLSINIDLGLWLHYSYYFILF